MKHLKYILVALLAFLSFNISSQSFCDIQGERLLNMIGDDETSSLYQAVDKALNNADDAQFLMWIRMMDDPYFGKFTMLATDADRIRFVEKLGGTSDEALVKAKKFEDLLIKLDSKSLTNTETNVLNQFNAKYPSITQDEFINKYRKYFIEYNNSELEKLLKSKAYDYDLQMLDELFDAVGSDFGNLKNFIKEASYTDKKQVLELLANLKVVGTKTIKPVDRATLLKLKSYGYDNININHIMDKHVRECFSIKYNLFYSDNSLVPLGKIDLLPQGTTQEMIYGYIFEALEYLKKEKISLVHGSPQEVLLADGRKAIIGSAKGDDIKALSGKGEFKAEQNIIGQFYLVDVPDVFTKSELNSLQKIAKINQKWKK